MLTDLGGVTRTLKTLIDAGLRLQSVPPADFAISAAPPDQNFSGTAVVSAYLFHVIESPETKNLPPSTPGSSPVPISLSPLGLILQYIITVVTSGDSDELLDSRALLQQKYLGFIARVVHDNPSITKNTRIKVPSSAIPIDILDPQLATTNKVIELVMRPAPKEETISFWSSEEKNVPRLSLFVEARVAVLEAQAPPLAPGIVLSIGTFVFPSTSPQLIATRNDIWFLPPPGFGVPRKITASPARVALFDAPGSADLTAFINTVPLDPPELRDNFLQNNRLTIDAVGLAPGHRLLLLRRGDTSITIDIDQSADERPASNVNWAFQASPDSVSVSVFREVFDAAANAPAFVLPGTYAARVVLMDARIADRPQPRASNEVPFTITPQIVSAAPATPAALDTYAIRIVGAYLNSSLDIFLAVGGLVLARIDSGAPVAGQFFVPPPSASPATDVNQITLVLHTTDPGTGLPIAPPSPTHPVPVQLVVNGATATPAWITAEATGI
jgi:hypothetical protein